MSVEAFFQVPGNVTGGNKLGATTVTDQSGNTVLFQRVSINDPTTDLNQATVSPQGTLSVNTEGTKPTYSAAVSAINLGTSATTDVWTITGSASKVIRVLRMTISGTIATTAVNFDVSVIKRSTADSGGTPAAATVTPYDANDAAGTATVNSYTGVGPTAGTTVGTVAARK